MELINILFIDVIKKASKCLYFLVQLKRSRVPRHDMSTFYTACIRSVLTYAAPAFFYALPKYLKDELVRHHYKGP